MSELKDKPGNTKIAFEDDNKEIKTESLQYLSLMSQLLCLSVPNLYNYKGISVWYILYAFAMLTFLLALFTWTLVYKLENYYRVIDKTAAIDIFVMIIQTVTNMISVLCAIFLKRKKLVTAVKQIQDMENLQKAPETKPEKFKCLLLPVILSFLLISSVVYALILHFLKINGFSFNLYAINIINALMVIVNTLQTKKFCKKLSNSFDSLNVKILDVINYLKKCKTTKKKPASSTCFAKTHDKLCDIVDTFSDVLGFINLSSCALFALQTLQTLNLILEFILKNSEISISVTINEVSLSTITTFVLLACGIITSLSCDEVKKEGLRTEAICYKLVMDLPARSNLSPENDLRENLLRLAQQVQFRQPGFSAVGCFNIDMSTISKVFGVIVGHTVLLLQFN